MKNSRARRLREEEEEGSEGEEGEREEEEEVNERACGRCWQERIYNNTIIAQPSDYRSIFRSINFLFTLY